MSNRNALKAIALNAIIAALYMVFTLIVYPIAFGMIQFRIAEILVLFCFFRRDLVFGLVIGCFMANVFSSLGPIDMAMGTGATLVACLGIILMPRLFPAALMPIAANGFIVGAELTIVFQTDYWINVLWVALGELAMMAVAYILLLILKRNQKFMRMIGATRRLEVKW